MSATITGRTGAGRRRGTPGGPLRDELEHRLRETVRGEIRFTDGDRALYATDASNYRQVPIGVVLPRDADDIVAAIAAARATGAPLLMRGGGTSLAGQCCNVALVLDCTKYLNTVLDVDPDARTARVQPGAVLDRVRDAARAHGLTFGPDPATHDRCAIGGMIGNNSCGVRSVMAEFYGPGPRTADNVEALEIATYDGVRMRVGATSDEERARVIAEGGRRGEIYARLTALRDRYARLIRERMPDIPRRVSGYGLEWLLPERGFHLARALVGSEGTCAATLEATVALIPNPRARALLVLGYPSVYEAADHVMAVRAHRPLGIEGMDRALVGYMLKKHLHPADLELLPDGGGWLLVEFGGDSDAEAHDRARALMGELRRGPQPPTMALCQTPDEAERVWSVRESGLGATAFVPGAPDTWPGWEDAAVAPERVGAYLRDFRALLDEYGYDAALYGHFGQGCVHTRIPFELRSAEGLSRYESFTQEAAELVVNKYDGSLSGEHGDGQARGDLLPMMFGPELVDAFREFKRIWDPEWKMNPGKVVDPAPRTADLRLGPAYQPVHVATTFRYPEDGGSLEHATLRCVGVGRCRRDGGGTMCPSWMVLHEEQHTTRGRAHLLYEMLRGDVITDGWRSEAVKASLDLCLSCKGCRSDCPVNVDIATHKAEFLSHYYQGRLRPRAAYALGFIPWVARAAALAPRLVNTITSAPGLGRLTKQAAGIAPQRAIPRFASETFTRWFNRRLRPASRGRRVLLWPDTFNDHFHPGTLAAAADTLAFAGCDVVVPPRRVCCGRPLYDFGMLRLARRQLRQMLERLREDIRRGTPLVGLEPSCVSVLRDELRNLHPDDDDARTLAAQTFTLGEYLEHELGGVEFPRLERTVLLHGHCHQKAVLSMDGERQALARLGAEVIAPDTGCCGMAGAFGFEREKFELSMAIGERVLLPAVRNATPETIIAADGFSCREQIRQGTGRQALHLAEILQLALRERGAAVPMPEHRVAERRPAELSAGRLSPATVALGAGAGLGVAWLARHLRRRRRDAEQTTR